MPTTTVEIKAIQEIPYQASHWGRSPHWHYEVAKPDASGEMEVIHTDGMYATEAEALREAEEWAAANAESALTSDEAREAQDRAVMEQAGYVACLRPEAIGPERRARVIGSILAMAKGGGR